MGIGHTLQELEGWRGQYGRVLRWHDRVRHAANGEPSADELDFLLAFFESCFIFATGYWPMAQLTEQ